MAVIGTRGSAGFQAIVAPTCLPTVLLTSSSPTCQPLPPSLPIPNLPRCRWVPDELAPAAFPRLGELRPIPVDAFDQRFDVWTITAPFSEGCGGPELPEEIIL